MEYGARTSSRVRVSVKVRVSWSMEREPHLELGLALRLGLGFGCGCGFGLGSGWPYSPFAFLTRKGHYSNIELSVASSAISTRVVENSSRPLPFIDLRVILSLLFIIVHVILLLLFIILHEFYFHILSPIRVRVRINRSPNLG